MDIFRQPKFAAYFYASQADPKDKIVLEPASYWTMGDKSVGGVEPLVVLSNCDEIELLVGGKSRGKFKPDSDTYPNLRHPPFIITNLGNTWGGDWQDATFIGYVKGKKVASKTMLADGLPKQLLMDSDDAALLADGADMTRISLRIVDAAGNIKPFAMTPVVLQVEGAGTLVGENPFPMPGGRGAVYVRAGRKPGKITITATAARLPPARVVVTVKKM
jgi:beta-galactosidase